MKTSYLAILPLVVFAHATFGQVTTPAVGFVSVNSAANSDTPVSLPLSRPAVLQTTVVSVVGNVATVASGLTANEYLYAAGTQTNHYYLSVKSAVSPTSTVVGKWYEILSNTGAASNATITVDPGASASLQAQGLAAGDVVEVIPFWTLNTLFPGGSGLTVTTDIDNPQDLILQFPQNVAGTNFGASKSSLYSTDTVNLGAPGWYDASSFDLIGDNPLLPDTYLMLRNRGAAQTVTVTGGVPLSAKSTNIVRLSTTKKQDNYVSNPFPVPVSLPELNLIESGVFESTTNIDAPKDLLLVYTGTEVGRNVQPSKVYLYSTDTANLPQVGWYDANSFDGPFTVTQKVIPTGSGLIVRKALGAIVNLSWTAPKPY